MFQKLKIFYFFSYLFLAILLLSNFGLANAASVGDQINSGLTGTGKQTGLAESGEPPVNFSLALINVINVLLGFLGIVLFILLIYGGWLWLFSRGNEEQVQKAKNIIREVIIGLIIILVARVITQFILIQLGETVDVNPI